MKNRFFHLLLILSIAGNIILAIQIKLKREQSAGLDRAIDLVLGKDKIAIGMGNEEVVNIIHHKPDRIRSDAGSIEYVWSTAYQPMPLTDWIWPPIGENGHYWLYVKFDGSGHVANISWDEM